MRSLTYYVATSLDGRICGPDDDFSAFPVEGDPLQALARDWADTFPAAAHAALGITPDRSRFDTVIMGWNTYAAGLPYGVDSPYPHLDQVVATRRHADAELPDGIRLTVDPEQLRRQKESNERTYTTAEVKEHLRSLGGQ